MEMQTNQPPQVDIGMSDLDDDDPDSELPVETRDEAGCCSAAVEVRMLWSWACDRLRTRTSLSERLRALAYQHLVRTLSPRLGSG